VSGHIALNAFAECVVRGDAPVVIGNGEQRHCYVHADDVGAAMAKMLEPPAAANRVYNIGNPSQAFSLNELAEKVIAGIAPGSGLVPNYKKRDDQKKEASDIVADTRRAEAELGFVPQISVEEGLKRIVGTVEASVG